MGALITIFTTAACSGIGYNIYDVPGAVIGAFLGVAAGVGIDILIHTPTESPSKPKAP